MNSGPPLAATDSTTLQLLVVVLPILGALFGAALGRWADARNRRSEHYAEAVRALVRWAEYPYRVRRRTSDALDKLSRLSELGHDLQEQLQCHHTWIQAECIWMGTMYGDAIGTLKTRTTDSTADAWRQDPVTRAGDMVLDGWGPGSIDDLLANLNAGVACRFGWRRLLAWQPTWQRRVLRSIPPKHSVRPRRG